MGAKIPELAVEKTMNRMLEAAGYERIHQGKVRDTYRISDNFLLVVATDRLSIFDFVLPVLIPGKGAVLTALTHYWLTQVFACYPHHLLNLEGFSVVNELKRALPELDLRHCLVVEDLSNEMLDFEMIFRHHIGGSVYKKYLETGTAGGHKLPPDLPKWSKLDEPIFTPSTKEDVGHDINKDAEYFFSKTGKTGKKLVAMLTEIYKSAYKIAGARGIKILDTKFEGTLATIADEILTPDSSRFVDSSNWETAMREKRDPDFLDKEPVRIWGKSVETDFGVTGINKLDPVNPEHTAFVHGLKIPEDIITTTSGRYAEIFNRLTGWPLGRYQAEVMQIKH